MMAREGEAAGEEAKRLYRRISWRLIPYIFVLYILCYLDRVNVGFAAVEFKRDLHLTDTAYGLGAGIFFLGQLLFDLPSNLLLQRVGPRVWIARIMITWGVIATAMMFVTGAHTFYVLRLLLGMSEGGFFPGMILYLTYWFPSGERARAIAKFMTATSLAGVVGGPLSGFLLKLEGRSGLHGWQWLFLTEGLSTVVMGVSVLFVLKDRPEDAAWLTAPEKQWLGGELERDRREGGASERHHLLDAFRLPMVWVLAVVFLLSQVGVYTVNLWMPLLLHSFLPNAGAGGVGMIARYGTLPYLAAAVCTVIVGWSSDRRRERRGHIAGCLLVSAAGFCWAAYAQSLPAVLAAMTFGAIGYWSMMGPFWALPTRVLGGRAAAGGVAIITMIGSIGGFFGPYLTGRLKDLTGGFRAGLLVIAGMTVAGACLCVLLRVREQSGSGGVESAPGAELESARPRVA